MSDLSTAAKTENTEASTDADGEDPVAAEQAGFDAAFEEFADPNKGTPASNHEDGTPEEGKAGEATGQEPGAAASEQTSTKSDKTSEKPGGAAAGEQPGTGERQPASTDADDEFKNLLAQADPKVRAAYEAAETRLKTFDQTDRSQRGRISGLNSTIRDIERAAESHGLKWDKEKRTLIPASGSTEQPSGNSQAASNENAKPPKSKLREHPKVKKAMEEYGEVVEPLVEAFEESLAAISGETESVKADVNRVRTQSEQERLEQAGRVLLGRHADYNDVIAHPSWDVWLYKQDKDTLDAAMANADVVRDGKAIADMVDKFKRDTGWGAGASRQPDGQQSTQTDAGAQAGSGANGAEPSKAATQSPVEARRSRAVNSAREVRTSQPGVTSAPTNDTFDAHFDEFADKAERQLARAM